MGGRGMGVEWESLGVIAWGRVGALEVEEEDLLS
jgi:hypothetical protein